MTTEGDAASVARRLIDCVTRGDLDGVDALYHDDIRCWRNLDGRELVKKQALKIVRFLGTLQGLRYDDVRIAPTPGGFVQQHTLCCTGPKGEDVRVPACLVARVDGGRIVRIDEYVDSAAMAPLMG
ncbi:MAG: nuclear transport factor 2 family protein [Myxococcota bacterium]|nr:nuclear transport factor 2 family protein [Myxococcales bacterium]